MNFDREIDDALENLAGLMVTREVLTKTFRELVELGYWEGRREAFAMKAPAMGALVNVLLNIETLSDGRVVIYVDDPTRCIVLQKTVPLKPKEYGFHE